MVCELQVDHGEEELACELMQGRDMSDAGAWYERCSISSGSGRFGSELDTVMAISSMDSILIASASFGYDM